jgi:putative flippase GtrA
LRERVPVDPSDGDRGGRPGHVWVIAGQFVRFGVIGVGVTLVDVAVFNLLLTTSLSGRPIPAKIITVLVATVVAYVGNRNWTFRGPTGRTRGGFTLFLLVNLIALAVPAASLAVSHHVLGLRSVLADNISANVVGSPLAVVFRFWTYRRFIFNGGTAPQPA